MGQQLTYEDIEVGMELPPLEKYPTTEQVVRYACASRDFARIHFDDPYARSVGFPSVILHGYFKSGSLAQLLSDWAGPRSWVKTFYTRYQQIDVPFAQLTCRGRVLDKYVSDTDGYVEVEIWTENSTGDVTTSGTATVLVPLANSQ